MFHLGDVVNAYLGGGSLVAKSCLILCDPMDCSPPVSSVHGVSQARIPEWAAISFSRHLYDPGIELASPVYLALQADSLPTESSGKPYQRDTYT